MKSYNEICQKLVNEHLENVLNKYFFDILFTKSWCIKIVRSNIKNYKKILLNESKWNNNQKVKTNIFWEITINGNRFSGLIIQRLPTNSNLLQKLYDDNLQDHEIYSICKKITTFQDTYFISNAKHDIIIAEHIKNFSTQVSFLSNYLDSNFILSLNKWFKEQEQGITLLLKKRIIERKVKLVHGDIFCSNIYIQDDDIKIIDPSFAIFSRRLDIVADFSMLCGEMLLLNPQKQDVLFNSDEVKEIYNSTERLLFNYYFIVKALVKVRFAVLEKSISSSQIQQWAYNQIFNNYKNLLDLL